MKLGIGTAQFGLDYGISNPDGKTSPGEVAKILEVAAKHGIRVIDTAPAYGTSEDVLGISLPPSHDFHIVTKTPRFSSLAITSKDVQLLEETFYHSLSKLRQTSMYGLLVHHVDDLFADKSEILMKKVIEFKRQGLVQKIGVSVYTGEQIDRVLKNYSIDLIQLPINILDRRLINSGYLKKIKKQGIEIHARSIFLQGLLLMEPESLPQHFDSIREHLQHYHSLLVERGISRVEAALSFVCEMEEVDQVLFGVNNCQQLQEAIISSYKSFTNLDFSKFAIEDITILNPSAWKV
jgi:aryl-alcohol dehydrogenase-like predicted oxidoreductase